MQTSFIAVQCFECSTMQFDERWKQVKQQKKSSNKWTCVVCNQKQSVRKVFAQSFMAKDVRKFVQNFNMSRQLSDQNPSISIDEPETIDSPKNEEQKRKRNDWTEYIEEDREESSSKFERYRNSAQGDDGIEPAIVTEMPKAMFVKPKVREYSSRAEKKLLKPSFPNRREGRSSQVDETADSERDFKRDNFTKEAKNETSKWNSFMSQIRETRDFAKKPVPQKTAASKKTVSKWSSFITEEEEDDDQSSGIREKREDHLPMNEEERVEEDIHPDFL